MKKKLQCIYLAIVAASLSLGCSSNGSNQNLPAPHVACQGFTLACQNGGTCGEGQFNGNYFDTCNCPAGYSGTLCENVNRTKFIGTWVGSSTTVPPVVHDTIVITAGAEIQQIYLFDKHNNGNGSEGVDTLAVGPNFFNGVGGSGGADIRRQGYFTDATNTTLIVVRTDLLSNLSSQFTGTKL